MVASLRRFGAISAASLALLASCSSDPTSAPGSLIAVPAGASASLTGTTTASTAILTNAPGLTRKAPLAASITAQASIGILGGSISIPQAGVTITVPAGALPGPLTISVTARAGSLVAYDFEPHGTVFAQPLVIVQSLTGTSANALTTSLLQLGYYSDPSYLTSTGGLVQELRGGTINSFSNSFTSTIPHFSGYMVAVGRY